MPSPTAMLRTVTTFAALCWMILGGPIGCASSEGPAEIVLDPTHYNAAFDAAVEATRRAGMPTVVRDRRAGIIETEARTAGSILEPWRTDNATASQALANTVSHQRRRVRFEFAPADGSPPPLGAEGPLPGPEEAGLAPPLFDLTQHEGDVRLIVTVAIERAHRPGLRVGTWSRRTTNYARSPHDPDEDQGEFWSIVGRDVAFERRLLDDVESLLRQNVPAP